MDSRLRGNDKEWDQLRPNSVILKQVQDDVR